MKKILGVVIVVVLFLSFKTNAQVNLSNGLAAYYSFNSTANDESGNGNNALVNGASSSSDRFGSVNKAYSFDGVDDFISTTYKHNYTNGISISLWFKTQTAGNYDRLFDDGQKNSVVIHFLDGGFLRVRMFGSTTRDFIMTLDVNENFKDARWHHVACSWDGTTSRNSFKLYVDNVLKGEGTPTQTLTYSSNFLNFGQFTERNLYPNDPNCFFAGSIDDIRVYSRSINRQEVEALFNEVLTSIESVGNTNKVKLYSEPKSGRLVVDFGRDFNPDRKYKIHILDTQSRTVHTSSLSQEIQTIYTYNSLSKGLYIVRIVDCNDNVVLTSKVAFDVEM